MWLFKQQADIFQTPVPLLPFLNSAPCNQVHNPVSGTHTAFACWIFDSLQIEDFFSKSLYYYQHYLNQVLLHLYACQIR